MAGVAKLGFSLQAFLQADIASSPWQHKAGIYRICVVRPKVIYIYIYIHILRPGSHDFDFLSITFLFLVAEHVQSRNVIRNRFLPFPLVAVNVSGV